MRKTISFFSLYMLLAFAAACNSKKEEKAVVEKYPVTSPIVVDTTYNREFAAEIQSIQNVEIRSKINGYIEKIFVDEGQSVKPKQLLFSINSETYQKEVLRTKALVQSALAGAKNAELDLQNVKYLAAKNIVSKTELEKAQANYSAALAQVEESRAEEANAVIRLSMTQIKAPFGGTIDRIPFKAGSLVNEGALLTTISDNSFMYAYFKVSEKEYLQFTASAHKLKRENIILLLANGEPHKYTGTIETVEGEIDPNTGNIAFRAKFPNPELILKHGSSGKIRIVADLNKVLIIPQKATYEVQDKQYVLVVDKNNTVHPRSIKLKQRIPHLYVIDSGLTSKDRIIYEGIQNLKDGDKIAPEFIPMKKLLKKLK